MPGALSLISVRSQTASRALAEQIDNAGATLFFVQCTFHADNVLLVGGTSLIQCLNLHYYIEKCIAGLIPHKCLV